MILLIGLLSFSAHAFDGEQTRILSGKPDYERDVDNSYSIEPEARLDIEHYMGSLEIVGWDSTEVRVQARIEVKGDKAREYGEKIKINVDGDGKTFRIETRYPRGKWKDLSFGVALRIQVPAGHAVEAENEFGDISLSGTRGGAEIEARNGTLDVGDVEGEKKLSSTFGSVRLVNSKGNTKIEAMNGAVRVEEMRDGNLDIEAKFGSIKVTGLKGDAVIESCNGDVTLKEIDGAVNVQGTFGKIALNDVSGDIDVKSKSGDVVIRKARGSVAVDVGFGSTKIEELKGNCLIESRNGAVAVTNVQGDVKIENCFGSIDVCGAGGNIDLVDRNGSISLEGIQYCRGQGKEKKANLINCSTNMGLIEIFLPDPPSCRLKAATRLGRIKSDFELTHREKSLVSESCRLDLGQGEAEIKLENSSGDILIRKKKEKKDV